MMAMLNLSKWLDENSGPPTDVTFVFKGVVKKELKAQCILSVASDVFERGFYGSLKEEKTTIEIVEAFLAMIHFIFNKFPFIWEDYKFRHWSELRFLPRSTTLRP